MKAIVLAGGAGKRLKRYTKDLPKGMLSFGGKTIIERQIEAFRACNITDIIVVRGFEASKINYKGVRYYTNENYATTNMVEGMMVAKAEFNDDLIVSYSDIIFDADMLKAMIGAEALFSCAVDDNWKAYWKKRYGRIDVDTESLVINDQSNIIELGLENPPLEMIDARFIGLLKFSVEGLHIIQKIMEEAYKEYEDKPWQKSGRPVKKAYMTDLLNAIIQSGYTVKAVHFNNGWIEFDTNEDYEKAIDWLKDGSISKLIKLHID